MLAWVTNVLTRPDLYIEFSTDAHKHPLAPKKVKVPILCYCGSPEFKTIPWTLVGKYKNICLLTAMLSMLIKDEKTV